MALSKNVKGSLLFATIVVGGITLGIDKVNTNKEIASLKSAINENKLTIETQNNELSKKADELEKLQKSLNDTQKSLKDTSESLEKTQKTLEDTEKELKNTKGLLKNANDEINSLKVSSYTRSTNTKAINNNTTKKGTPVKMTITFYGDGADENGGYAGMTASGAKLRDGIVASNYYAFGTKFELNGKIYTVSDRGGRGLNGPNNLDVFVPRKAGESTSAYKARIRKYGRRTVTMYKL